MNRVIGVSGWYGRHSGQERAIAETGAAAVSCLSRVILPPRGGLAFPEKCTNLPTRIFAPAIARRPSRRAAPRRRRRRHFLAVGSREQRRDTLYPSRLFHLLRVPRSPRHWFSNYAAT